MPLQLLDASMSYTRAEMSSCTLLANRVQSWVNPLPSHCLWHHRGRL